MRLINMKTKVGSASFLLSLLSLSVLGGSPALAASSFGDSIWQFASGNALSMIDFNRGSSAIWDNGNLHVATDDLLYLDANQSVVVSNALMLNNGPLIVSGTTQTGTLNVVSGINVGGTHITGSAVT